MNFQELVRKVTRCNVIPGMDQFVKSHPNLQARLDSSVYFVKVQLHEPTDGSSHLRLGNWVELQSEFDNANGVPPSQSKDNYDAGLFKPDLVPPAQCTSNMRVAFLDMGNWPIIALMNFHGKFA